MKMAPVVEPLESRLAPATFVVTNAQESGEGSLRQAILEANDHPGKDAIEFAIGSGVQTIALATALPDITDAVQIRGKTQPGFDGKPLIVLDGSATTGANGLTFLDHKKSSVQALVIDGFDGAGIALQGGGKHSVESCYLGLDATGTATAGNGTGLSIVESDGNIIGPKSPDITTATNYITGNAGAGVSIRQSDATKVAQLAIGAFAGEFGGTGNGGHGLEILDGSERTKLAGVLAFANALDGLHVEGARSRLDACFSVRNGGDGLEISGADNVGTRVSRTLIGLNPQDTADTSFGNGGSGVFIGGGAGGARLEQVSTNYNGGNGVLITGSDANRLAAVFAERNGASGVALTNGAAGNRLTSMILSGNTASGLALTGGATGNALTLSAVGTTGTGAEAQGNAGNGVIITESSDNLISRNVISSNAAAGVLLEGNGTTGNRLTKNYIGLDGFGASALGNGDDGIRLQNGASDNVIGGAKKKLGNLISGNAGDGVQISGAVTLRNVVEGNRIGLGRTGDDVANTGRGVLISHASYSLERPPREPADNIIVNNKFGANLAGNIDDGL